MTLRAMCTSFALPILCAVAMTAVADPALDFAREPLYGGAVVSPSGRYLAAVVRDGREEFIALLDGESFAVRSSIRLDKRMGIADLAWASDERLLIWPSERFVGIDWKSPTGEIIAVNADGSATKRIYGYRAGLGMADVLAPHLTRRASLLRRAEPTAGWARLIEVLSSEPDTVLISSQAFWDRGRATRAARLDIRDGTLFDVAASPILDGDFVATPAGDVILTFGADRDDHYALYHRAPGRRDFKQVMRRARSEGRLVPIAASDPASVWVFDDENAATAGVATWDPESGRKRLVYRHERVDVDGVFFAERRRTVWALRTVDHYPDYHYPDAEHPLAKAHRAMRAAAPDDDVVFTSVSDDGTRAVAFVHGDRNPGTYHLVDVDRRTQRKIGEARPWLDVKALAPTTPVEITAHDGQRISAYLTEPTGFASPGPLVVLVHYGPHGTRDSWEFDPVVQLLAQSGYAVLQVNFRGSGGFGRAFEAAGYGEWGGTMQRDVTDATRWAIGDGVADPDRICIGGFGYGAYAALTGTFQEPDLYRCAVGISGVYDLPLMRETHDKYRRELGDRSFEDTLGDDATLLHTRSPVHNAERIRAAILLAHGGRDEYALPAHAERLRDALVRAGNPPEWVFEPRDGHGILGEENLAALYRRVLEFLEVHTRRRSVAGG